MDLDGKIVFKVKLGNEIKKIVIHNDDINYNELLLMMQRIFSETIKPNEEFKIKYTDEENDLITLSNDSDVSLALQNSKILKLTIFLNDKKEEIEELKPADIVKELQNIRLSIDKFLEKFERSLKLDTQPSKVEDLTKTANEIKLTASNVNGIHPMIKSDIHKEFDPLSLNKKTELIQQDSNKNKNLGSQTPDSIGSLELSPKIENPNFINQNKLVTGDQHIAPPQFQVTNAPKLTQDAQQHNFQHQQQQLHQFQTFNPQQQSQIPQQPMQMQQMNQTNQFNPNQNAKVLPQQIPTNQVYSGPQYVNGVQHQANVQTNQQIDSQLQQQMHHQQMQQQHQMQQQYFQQQQQNATAQGTVPHSGMMPPQGMQNPQFLQQQAQLSNPYSKPPSVTATARPPSATLYQQGYK